MSLQRLDTVRRAAWIVTTRGRHEVSEGHLIGPDQEDENLLHRTRASLTVRTSTDNSANEAVLAAVLARSRTSIRSGLIESCVRASSFRRRFTLFLSTPL